MRIGQNSVINFVSQMIASLAGFAVTLYIARTLGADGLGVYTLIVSVAIWLHIIVGGGFNWAMKQRLNSREEGDAFLTAALLLETMGFVAIATVLIAGGHLFTSYLRGINPVVLVGLSFSLLAFSFVTAALDGQGDVHFSSLLYPVERVIRSGLQVAAIMFGYAVIGLLIGYITATIAATLIGTLFVSTRFARPTKAHIVDIVSYARYAWVSNLSSRAFAAMDTIVLGLFVVEGFIGIYESAWNLASIMALFGTSVSRAMFPELSRLSGESEKDAISNLVTDSLRYAGLLLIPGLIGAVLIGDQVLRIYGPEFTKGHQILVILVFARLVHVYQSQFVNTLKAVDRPDIAFRIDGLFIGLNIVVNIILVWQFGWLGAAVATASTALVALSQSYWHLNSLIGITVPRAELAKQWFAAIVMGIVILLWDAYLPSGIYYTLGIVFGGAITYVATLATISMHFRATVRANFPI